MKTASEAASEIGDNGSESQPKAPSLLDGLREQRRALGEERTLELDIPGYATLVARYHPLDWETLNRIGTKAEKAAGPRATYLAATDILARACECMLIRREGKLIPLQEVGPGLGDEPIRYDERLARVLGFEASSAREVVWGVFQTKAQREAVLTSHFNDLMTWMQDGSAEDDRDFGTSS